jgi:hypothetical protein
MQMCNYANEMAYSRKRLCWRKLLEARSSRLAASILLGTAIVRIPVYIIGQLKRKLCLILGGGLSY